MQPIHPRTDDSEIAFLLRGPAIALSGDLESGEDLKFSVLEFGFILGFGYLGLSLVARLRHFRIDLQKAAEVRGNTL
jgi:hypothetical protein